MDRFHDRRQAGRALAASLTRYAGRSGLLVLALPRGGVPVGYEVATRLKAPLHPFIVRKLGVPGEEEFAMGALASGGVKMLDEDLIVQLGISAEAVQAVVEKERAELERRELRYRKNLPPLDVTGKTAILVDDGLATGWTMRAAIRGLRLLGPARLVVGVPVGAPDTCQSLARDADEVVCTETPEPFHSVGDWYGDFSQTTDLEVRVLLEAAHARTEGAAAQA